MTATTRARRAARTTSRWATTFSRQGAISRLTTQPTARLTVHRAVSMVTGAGVIGLGVAFFVHARLGLAPYDVLVSVLRDRLSLSLGQSSWVLSGFLFVVAALLGQRARPSALVYVLACGAAVDISLGLIESPDAMWLRVLFVAIGTAAIVGGIALVVHSGLTGGSFELLMKAGAERGLDPMKVRTSLEVGIVIAGVALGGDAGFATLAFAVAVGPTMKWSQQALLDHRAGRTARLAGATGD